MNTFSLKPAILSSLGAGALLLAGAAWITGPGTASAPASMLSMSMHHQSAHPQTQDYSAHQHLTTMSDAERAALVRLQLATANGRWFP